MKEAKLKTAINGFRYNTDTAIKVGSYETPLQRTDLSYWRATLYMTSVACRYFLVGYGQKMTRFATELGKHAWSDGTVLVPLSNEAAEEWIGSYLK